LAIAGFPPLAGFFSKDEILWQAWVKGHEVLWLMGVVTAGLTSFYMFRMLLLTFYGEGRMSAEVEHHVHESPGSMTGVLMVLALGSVVVGWVGIPPVLGQYLGGVGNGIERFLEPVFEVPVKGGEGHGSPGTEWLLMGISVGMALGGLLLARSFYLKNPALPERLKTRYRALYITLLNKYWVDEIYDALIVRPTKVVSTYLLWRFCDVLLIDGLVNGAAKAVRGSGGILKRFQSGSARLYAGWILLGAIAVIFYIAFLGPFLH
jgi:NADH-quinone oxidoreductase subunit L